MGEGALRGGMGGCFLSLPLLLRVLQFRSEQQ